MNLRPYEVVANRRIYHVVDDLTSHFALIVAGQVRSAATGEPVRQFDVRAHRDAVAVNIMGDGFFALGGNTRLLFPDLDATAYSIDLTITAPHHRSLDRTVNIPANSAFPLPLLAISLIANTVRVAGRVTLAVDGSAVTSGNVRVLDPAIATLRTPLHVDHPAGATVRPATVAPNGPARALAAEARPGADALVLDFVAGLGANPILRLGQPHEFEYVAATFPGAAPNSVSLLAGMRRGFAAGATVQPVTVTPGAPPRALTEDLLAGDGLLPLDGPIAGDTLIVEDALSARTEVHALGALADSQGYYRIDGLGHLPTFTLFAANAANTRDAEREWSLDLRRPVNIVDLSLT